MAQEKKSQSPVSLPVIILGGIALVVAVVLLWPTGQSGPVNNNNPTPVTEQPKMVGQEIPKETTVIVQETPMSTSNPIPETLISNSFSDRDPFSPSQLFVKATTKVISQPVSDNSPTRIEVRPVQTDGTSVATPSPSATPSNEPIWKGIVGTQEDQVVLINYNQKSYNLRLGDKLPTTNYIVAGVNSDNVVLMSPKQKLVLRMKKGVKK